MFIIWVLAVISEAGLESTGGTWAQGRRLPAQKQDRDKCALPPSRTPLTEENAVAAQNAGKLGSNS